MAGGGLWDPHLALPGDPPSRALGTALTFRSLARARTELAHKVAGSGGAALALLLPAPFLPLPLRLPLLPPPAPVSSEITAGRLRAALKSRESGGSSARAAGGSGRSRRRVGDRGTPGCHGDGKALDSGLLRGAEAANVGAGFDLRPPLRDFLAEGRARAGGRGRSFRNLWEKAVCAGSAP